MAAGVTPEKIVFANPIKTRSMLRFARKIDVPLMTFDTRCELEKIKEEFPEAKLLLRLKVDDSSSRYRLSEKFGATRPEVPELLSMAQHLGLRVVGVAFHVGSGSEDQTSFSRAIEWSKEVAQLLPDFGFQMQMLDVGGGFPGLIDFEDREHLFYKMVGVINQSIELHFPMEETPSLEVISEPGKYFVASAFRLLTKVVGKRVSGTEEQPEHVYYLNDGLFGGFLIKMWEPETVNLSPCLPAALLQKRQSFPSTVWGPTCDSSDVLFKRQLMKELMVGDFLQVSLQSRAILRQERSCDRRTALVPTQFPCGLPSTGCNDLSSASSWILGHELPAFG